MAIKIKLSSTLEFLVKITLVLANVAIVSGIIFAYYEFQSNQEVIKTAHDFEKRKNALEAISKVYNSEFLTSFAKLKGGTDFNTDEMKCAMNLVFNTYYMIAILYNSDQADKPLIEQAINGGIAEFVKFPAYINMKSSAKEEIETMSKSINTKYP